MKAALIFNLPEERCEFEIASSAMKWALIVFNINEMIRDLLRHGHSIPTANDALEFIRRELHTRLEDRNLSLDMIE